MIKKEKPEKKKKFLREKKNEQKYRSNFYQQNKAKSISFAKNITANYW